MHAALGFHAAAQRCRGTLELFVGDQALDEHLTQRFGVESGVFVVNILVIDRGHVVVWHERGGLDVEKRCRDEQKIACDVQVQGLDALEVLVGDLGDRDGADIHLLARHKLQQQIEGTGEALRGHTIGHRPSPLSASNLSNSYSVA